MTAAGARRRPYGLIAALAVVVAGLAALDRSLERIESMDLSGAARHDYEEGLRLIGEGRAQGAIDPLRNAHALERENRDYELQLIVALTNAGKTGEADPLMGELLQRAPNDGQVNLIAARLANKEGRSSDAAAYYHRAIYGEWPEKGGDRRMAVRMELVGFLREKGTKPELLAELISLEAEAPRDRGMQRSLAHLLLAAGAPGRAAEIYRSLVEEDPKDTQAFAGLGEAELEQGRYRDAHAAFLQAFFHTPADAPIRTRLQLLNTVMALDPTPRGLPAAEKYERSRRILELARTSLQQCTEKMPKTVKTPAEEEQDLLILANAELEARAPRPLTNELAERLLSLAQAMWQARVKACGGIPANEDALRLIMEKLAA